MWKDIIASLAAARQGLLGWRAGGHAGNALYIVEPSEHISTKGIVNSSDEWIPEGALFMALAGQRRTKGMAVQLGINVTRNQSTAAIAHQKGAA